jgi:hypothetical protein
MSEMDLLDLVKQKLLCGTSMIEDNPSGSLVCPSVRFALEFNVDRTAGDIARTLVERHMRMSLAATAGKDTLVTLGQSRF